MMGWIVQNHTFDLIYLYGYSNKHLNIQKQEVNLFVLLNIFTFGY